MSQNLSDNNDYSNPTIVTQVEDIFEAILNDDEYYGETVINYLIENGSVDLNTIYPPYDYNNFLMAAVLKLRVSIVEILLNFGINPNILSREGLTPLDYAFIGSNLREFTQEEIQKQQEIIQMITDEGGLRADQLPQRNIVQTLPRWEHVNVNYDLQDRLSNQTHTHSSGISSISEPDYELLKNQAATIIQKIIRGRQERQNQHLLQRVYGYESPNPTQRERMRRFTDHTRALQSLDDPLSGYLYDIYFPKR